MSTKYTSTYTSVSSIEPHSSAHPTPNTSSDNDLSSSEQSSFTTTDISTEANRSSKTFEDIVKEGCKSKETPPTPPKPSCPPNAEQSDDPRPKI